MNIIREDAHTAEPSFYRGHRRDQERRILLLVRFPRAEFVSDTDRIAELERFFGS